jgi:hypothetical protein
MDEPRDPTLETLLDLHREVLLEGVHVMMPGRIVSYDATLQKADVQPLVKGRHFGEDGETLVVQPMPVVQGCPVVFCGRAGGRITWPVAVGDTCELRCSSVALARWLKSGGLVDPGDDRRHDLADAICQVGLHDFAHVPTDAPTDAVVIHVSGGVTIKLGSSSASKAPAFNDDLAQLISTLSGVTPGVGSGDAAIAALQSYLGLHPTFPAGSAKVTIE